MAEIVNLRRVRKQKQKAAAETQAAENRALYGRSRQAKEADKAVRALDERRLEAHRRENGGDGRT